MPIELIYTVYDRRNKPATTSVKLDDTVDNTELGAFHVAWANALDNLIGGVIRTAAALMRVSIAGVTSNVAQLGSDVEEIGAFQFVSDNGDLTEVNVPAIDEDFVDNESGNLDPVVSQVAAFITMMETGITVGATLVEPASVGSSPILDTVYAREGSRNSGKRRNV